MAAAPLPTAAPAPSAAESEAVLAAMDASRAAAERAYLDATADVLRAIDLDAVAGLADLDPTLREPDSTGARACFQAIRERIAALRGDPAPVSRAGTVLPFVQRGGRHAR